MRIEEYLQNRARRIEERLAAWLGQQESLIEPRLLEAMRYSLLSGGKRIRPILCLAAGEAVGARPEPILPFACALEMVHTYSLIHDDLPAMDDDDTRRGRPSNHRVFGEGIAILAGDALLTEAFAVASLAPRFYGVSVERALEAVAELAVAAGAQGMVGGQTADLLAEGAKPELERIESIHKRKTGALLRAAVRIGAIVAEADETALDGLTRYGESIGLAFQVADDLLDAAGDTVTTGKSAQRDEERGKSTVPAALGMRPARALLEKLLESGLAAVAHFDARADPLREIARYVVSRALPASPPRQAEPQR